MTAPRRHRNSRQSHDYIPAWFILVRRYGKFIYILCLVVLCGVQWQRLSRLSPASTTPIAKTSIRHSITQPPLSSAYNGTILLQLSGEFGNHLHKLALAKALQWMAQDEYGLDLKLVLKHQDHPKWLSARKDLQKCFASLRPLHFKEGNNKAYESQKLQQKMQGWDLELHGHDRSSLTNVLDRLQDVLKKNKELSHEETTAKDQRIIEIPMLPPVIWIDQMVGWEILDEYRDRLVEWLLPIDSVSCCGDDDDHTSNAPYPDETVFHFRNFVTELQGATQELGFEELSPFQTAHELLGHVPPGNKVAITTRFDNEVTQGYVQALKDRGVQVRVMAGQSATQDFCFLSRTQHQLVGGQRSTFFVWAAYLGLAHIDKVLSYSVSPPNFTAATTKDSRHAMRVPYEWKRSPLLQQKWEFQTFEGEGASNTKKTPTKIKWATT